MSPSFATMKNALPMFEEAIPLLEIELWRHWILETCRNGGGRIVALFAVPRKQGPRLFGILGVDTKGELRVAMTDLQAGHLVYPSLTPDLPQAHLFERELAEEFQILPEGHPWLKAIRSHEGYPFYRMEGEGIHEVAVGPVHAGIIEPGHFRFQCHGERVFHLEMQLGYQHRGVEQLMIAAKPTRRAVLAESIAGDTVMGHGLAYCHAVEGLSGRAVPQRAKSLRAIVLELERISNHVGDLGALAADVGFLPAAAFFGRLRGEFLNLLMMLTGNRYGRSFIRPGGVLFDLTKEMFTEVKRCLTKATSEFKEVAELFFSATSVLERLERTGVVASHVAKALDLVGPTARASNLMRDVRHDYPTGAYRFHSILPVRLASGDVYARARIRSLESKSSLEFILDQLDILATEKIFVSCGGTAPSSLIISMIEGWRGEIAHVVLTDEEGEPAHYKIVDPSFHNWVALSLAMRNGQISDFPLCNKSFNLSYAGCDL